MVGYGQNTFAYGADGIRCRKNNVHYTLDGSRILQEYHEDTEETLTFYYGEKGVFGFRHRDANGAENDYFYRKNLFGDVVAIYDANGHTVAFYSYDAWGRVSSATNSTALEIAEINPFRYRSYYYDTETCLYYLESRYYDPELCRFLNPDTIDYLGDGEELHNYNLFSYCGNNPVMYFDPTGHFSQGTFWLGLGMLALAAIATTISVATFGAGTPLAIGIVAGITLGAGVVTGINGIATILESHTGYNFIRDGLFNELLGVSDDTYNLYAGISAGVAFVGSAILCGYHTTGQYKAAKYSRQYLGKGYKKVEKNRWVSKDGFRQVRWDKTHHIIDGKPSRHHFNTYKFPNNFWNGGRNKPLSENHIWYKLFSMTCE